VTVRVARGLPALLVATVVLATTLAACGDDDRAEEGDVGDAGAAVTGTTAAAVAEELPPLDSLPVGDVEGLQEVYGEPLAALDLVLTRGGVVEYRGGTHLQLYVEPTTSAAENGPQVYLDRMLTSYQAILPLLFDAYPDMDSFDICQEVVPAADAGPAGYEEPVTVLLITREGFESVDDWSTATLADLFDAASEDLGGHFSAEPEVVALPDYQAATGEA
jgi:hypothetical protein